MQNKTIVMVPLFSTLSSLDAKLSISVLLSLTCFCKSFNWLISPVAVARVLLRFLTVVFKSESPTVLLLTGSAADAVAGLLGEGTSACSSSATVCFCDDNDDAEFPDFFLLAGAIFFLSCEFETCTVADATATFPPTRLSENRRHVT